MSRLGAANPLISCCLGTTFEVFPARDLAVVSATRKDPDYHKKGICCQAFSGSKKNLYLVMPSSTPWHIIANLDPMRSQLPGTRES